MSSDLVFAALLYIGLLVFYRCNEPKARKQDQKRQQQDSARRNH